MHENSTNILWNTKIMHKSLYNATIGRPDRARYNTSWNSGCCTICNSATVSVVELYVEYRIETLSKTFNRRDPVNFPDPDFFDPERFSPEQKALRHKSAFMPFSDGKSSGEKMKICF